jgi:hypothetical protein
MVLRIYPRFTTDLAGIVALPPSEPLHVDL